MSKGLKIGLGIGLVLLLIVILYFIFRSPNKGEKGYVDLGPGAQHDAFVAALVSLGYADPNGYTYNGKQNTYTAEELARGYLKKNNLAITAANVSTFATEIKAYIAAPGSLPHWKLNT